MDDDVAKVIEQAKKIHAYEKREYIHAHRLTDLPASKDAMKTSIKERVRLLYGLYISLATYVCDDDFKLLIEGKKKHKKRIYKRIAKDIEEYTTEIQDFKPLD